jgi:hypothetical protein
LDGDLFACVLSDILDADSFGHNESPIPAKPEPKGLARRYPGLENKPHCEKSLSSVQESYGLGPIVACARDCTAEWERRQGMRV